MMVVEMDVALRAIQFVFWRHKQQEILQFTIHDVPALVRVVQFFRQFFEGYVELVDCSIQFQNLGLEFADVLQQFYRHDFFAVVR